MRVARVFVELIEKRPRYKEGMDIPITIVLEAVTTWPKILCFFHKFIEGVGIRFSFENARFDDRCRFRLGNIIRFKARQTGVRKKFTLMFFNKE